MCSRDDTKKTPGSVDEICDERLMIRQEVLPVEGRTLQKICFLIQIINEKEWDYMSKKYLVVSFLKDAVFLRACMNWSSTFKKG